MSRIDRVGEKHITREGYTATIIEYYNNTNCTVQLNDKGRTVLTHVVYDAVKKGSIKNPYHPSVCKKGYIGVGIYKANIGCKATVTYSTWKHMLERCYNEKRQEVVPTYIDCHVDKRWFNFQVFAKWFEENHVKSSDLDKDILVKGNKIYSPETCCFVPQEVNKIIIKRDKSRGDLPIGVAYNKRGRKYTAQLSINGKTKNLGYFDTIEEAFQAYKLTKEVCIKELAEFYKDQITEACYQALINYNIEITD